MYLYIYEKIEHLIKVFAKNLTFGLPVAIESDSN